MAAAFKLLVAAGLGAAYLAIAFAAAHPHVAPEYAAHYLHRTADCWDPWGTRAGDGSDREVGVPAPPDTVEIAGLAYPEACRYLRRGWDVTEDWGAWSDPKRAILHLPPRPGAVAVAVTLRAAPPPGPAIRAQLSIDGGDREIREVVPAGATRVVTLPLPPGGADVEIRCSDHTVIPALPPDARTRHVNPAPLRDQPPPLATRWVGVGLIAIHYLPEEGQPARMPPRAD